MVQDTSLVAVCRLPSGSWACRRGRCYCFPWAWGTSQQPQHHRPHRSWTADASETRDSSFGPMDGGLLERALRMGRVSAPISKINLTCVVVSLTHTHTRTFFRPGLGVVLFHRRKSEDVELNCWGWQRVELMTGWSPNFRGATARATTFILFTGTTHNHILHTHNKFQPPAGARPRHQSQHHYTPYRRFPPQCCARTAPLGRWDADRSRPSIIFASTNRKMIFPVDVGTSSQRRLNQYHIVAPSRGVPPISERPRAHPTDRTRGVART
jgi:hypothetical protein